jgi:hypothetical protein
MLLLLSQWSSFEEVRDNKGKWQEVIKELKINMQMCRLESLTEYKYK